MTAKLDNAPHTSNVAFRWRKFGLRTFWAAVLALAIVTGCDSAADGSPHAEGSPMGAAGNQESSGRRAMLSEVSATSFKVVVDQDACPEIALSSNARVFPSEADLTAMVGSGSVEFIVLMTEEIDLGQYPIPSRRDVAPESDADYMARAGIIAESQRCAIRSLRDLGGEYLHSYVLTNSLSAKLTVEQAIQLSRRADVRSLQLAESNEPPPGGGT